MAVGSEKERCVWVKSGKIDGLGVIMKSHGVYKSKKMMMLFMACFYRMTIPKRSGG